MRGIGHWRTLGKTLLIAVLALLLAFNPLNHSASQAARKGSAPKNEQSKATAKTTGGVAETAPPEVIQELREDLEKYQPQVSILNPKPDEVVSDNAVSVRFQVKDLPIFKNTKLGLGPHLHVFLDNRPYQAVYDLSTPLRLENLEPGTHTLRVFASRPWHESFKNDGAYTQVKFHVFTKTQENDPNSDLPLLTYSRPQGSYGAEPIMLDFYLTNAPLHLVAQANPEDDIADWRIRCTINGNSFILDRWQPVYLKGFKPGKNWVQLEFLDDKGNPVSNVFNNTARVITYEPNGNDTLAKLTRGELSAKAARGIVDPNYVPEEPAPKPVPSPTPSPNPTPEISPLPIVPPVLPTPAPELKTKPDAKISPEPKSTTKPKVVKPSPAPIVPSAKPSPTVTPKATPKLEPSPEKPAVETPKTETPKTEVSPIQETQPTITQGTPESKAVQPKTEKPPRPNQRSWIDRVRQTVKAEQPKAEKTNPPSPSPTPVTTPSPVVEILKPTEAPKPTEVPKTIETPKAIEVPKTIEAPKAATEVPTVVLPSPSTVAPKSEVAPPPIPKPTPKVTPSPSPRAVPSLSDRLRLTPKPEQSPTPSLPKVTPTPSPVVPAPTAPKTMTPQPESTLRSTPSSAGVTPTSPETTEAPTPAAVPSPSVAPSVSAQAEKKPTASEFFERLRRSVGPPPSTPPVSPSP